jgi:ParB family chromosome partitioning protein
MNEPPKKPLRGLGRGLDALLPARVPATPARPASPSYEGNVFSCPLDKIVPQKGQPRQHFDNEKLDELAQSLKEHGLPALLYDVGSKGAQGYLSLAHVLLGGAPA